jgi:hypothetical protein
LAVEYIDRFLSLKENMKADRLQLVGMTAVFLAAKAEVGLIAVYPGIRRFLIVLTELKRRYIHQNCGNSLPTWRTTATTTKKQ